jgi:hypothetical protein
MGDVPDRGGRAGLGAAVLFAIGTLLGCAPNVPPVARSPAVPTSAPASPSPFATPIPSSPTAFDIGRVEGTFPAVTALVSTGERLYWASEASIWRFRPGDSRAERVYENPARDALVWDLAAAGDGVVFSERLAESAGSWRVSLLSSADAPTIQVDAGVAERGAPPTVAIDAGRIAWAGFDEGSGEPRTFLRVAGRSEPGPARTLVESDIEDLLLWHPRLDGDTLWYATIDPDFEATGSGDAFHIETIDLAAPAPQPLRFQGADQAFEPVVTPAYVAWKKVDPGFSALTWGAIQVMDRHSGERFLVATRANHPSIGGRFVTYEEFFHRQLLIYDLAAHRSIEIPDPLRGSKGTIGTPAIGADLLGYSTSTRGEKTVYWARLPD